MLTRFWQWTSAPAQGAADSSIPHGPLRFRSWTSLDGPQPATIIPHGPLRFRAWTSGPFVEPPEPPEPPPHIATTGGGGLRPFLRVPLDELGLRKRLEDDELIAYLTSWLTATQRKH